MNGAKAASGAMAIHRMRAVERALGMDKLGELARSRPIVKLRPWLKALDIARAPNRSRAMKRKIYPILERELVDGYRHVKTSPLAGARRCKKLRILISGEWMSGCVGIWIGKEFHYRIVSIELNVCVGLSRKHD